MSVNLYELVAQLRAENERLSGEIATLHIITLPTVRHSDEAWANRVQAKDREIARLRTALTQYASGCNWRRERSNGPLDVWDPPSATEDNWNGPDVARAALAPEPGGEEKRRC